MTNREEAAIARTPKASEPAKPRRAPARAGKAAAPGKAAAKPRATAAKPAPKPKAAPRQAAAKAATAKPTVSGKAAASSRTRAAKPAPKQKAAPPRPVRSPRARPPKVAPALLDRLVAAARKSLEDDKAEDIVVLDVTGRADYADRLVIATGLADRQIQAMATHLEDAFEKAGLKLRRDAIQASPDWVLMDAGDLVVHLFKPQSRQLYALERMWGPESPAPEQDRTPLPDDGQGGSTATEDEDE